MMSNSSNNMDANITTTLTSTRSSMMEAIPEENSQFGTSMGTLVTVVVMLSLFTVIGIIGNALAFYIYFKKRDKTTSNVFILALAATDFIVCLLVVPFTMVAEFVEYEFIYDIWCKLYMFCITSNIPLSAFIMTAIAFDRYCCICHPFLHVLTVPRARNTCIVLTFVAAIMGVITALNFSVYRQEDVVINETNSLINETLNSSIFTWNNKNFLNVTFLNGTLDINDTSVMEYHAANDTIVYESRLEYVGVCLPNPLLSLSFINIYQKLYACIFLMVFIFVAILYALIYRSIIVRRRWRTKRKRRSVYTSVNGVETMAEETQLTVVNGNNIAEEKKPKRPIQNRQLAIREKTLYANIKTAAMLFVVTVVFVISFLPSFLMGLQYIPFNVIVYNIYFLNNVANPIIYAFMNRAFRDDLRALIKSCR